MEDADWLSDLKIRFSWGTNGSVQGLPRGYTTTPFTTNYLILHILLRDKQPALCSLAIEELGLVTLI